MKGRKYLIAVKINEVKFWQMRLLNIILNVLFHFLPVPVLERFMNRSLPKSAKTFKRFSRINPSLFEYLSRKKVMFMFRRASRLIPAYREFLKHMNVPPVNIKDIDDFDRLVPPTSKDNYIRQFPLNERCLYGRYPDRGSVEESAGTSSLPTFWVRSQEEEEENAFLMKATMKHLFGFGCNDKLVLLNAFASGGWSGGLRFASRLGYLGIVKNTGPDPQKIIRTMKELGTKFTYLLGGYPPFITELIEFGKKQTDFNWKEYTIHFFPGGEGFAEKWRDNVSSQMKEGTKIFSVYGAIDLDVGISVETPFTVVLRKLIRDNLKLRNAVLKSDRLPCFIGQVSNQKFYVREAMDKNGIRELEITVMNLKSVSPNIKYLIGDEGGVIKFRDICNILGQNGYPLADFAREFKITVPVPFPVLFLYGRSDGTVTINGALISPSEIYEAILSDNELISSLNTFKMSVESDTDNFIKLFIFLEARENIRITDSLIAKSNDKIITGLLESNECFRNSYNKNPEIFKPVLKIIPFRTGLFSGTDNSVKNIYLNKT